MNSYIDPQQQSAVDQLDQAISVVDSDLRFVLTNRQGSEILGLPPEVLRSGTSLGEDIKVDSAATLKKPMEQALLLQSIRSALSNEGRAITSGQCVIGYASASSRL